MRDKDDILDNTVRATEEPSTDHQSYIKLTALTIEVLIDIRDILNSKTEQIASDMATILDSL